MKKGMIYTLIMVVLGGSLIAFAVTQNQISKNYHAGKSIMRAEKAASLNANAAYNIQNTFKKVTRIKLAQTGDTLSISEILPNNMTKYTIEKNRVVGFITMQNPETTAVIPPLPNITSVHNITYLHKTDGEVDVGLPYDTGEISLTGSWDENASCTLTCPDGTCTYGITKLLVDIGGNDGTTCLKTGKKINILNSTYLDIYGGGTTMSINNGVLTLRNTLAKKLNYTLTITTNHTKYVKPLLLSGRITTEINETRKESVISIHEP